MSKKIQNVVIVYDCAEINGGAAKVAIQSALALSFMDDIKVYFFAASGPINSKLQKSIVSVTCLGLDDINSGSRLNAITRGIWNKTSGRAFSSFLDQLSPDNTIVHIHGWVKSLSSSVVKVSCAKGFKSLITLHDYFTLCPNGGFYNYQKKAICTRKPMSINCILCNCDKRNYAQKLWRVARQVIQDRNVRYNKQVAYISISEKNESIVKPYVRSNAFYRVQNPVQCAKKMIDNCSESRVLLYVGRLSDEKGVELFCEAIEVITQNYDVEGVVVGDGVLFTDLQARYGAIHFEGWKTPDEVQAYIQKARMLVLPSKWYEGAPLNIIEAMSAGLPCIVSDCTSATELITDGENGLIFCAGDVDSLKEKMLEAMDDEAIKAQQMNIKRNFNKEKYAESAHAERLMEVYGDWFNK